MSEEVQDIEVIKKRIGFLSLLTTWKRVQPSRHGTMLLFSTN
jgi:hypothetical protein